MKYKWLNKDNNEKLIVFFNGWGMDENAVKHLDCEDYDVVIIYDYNDLELNLDLSDYKEKHVIGWSMGVMIMCLEGNKYIIKNSDSIIAIAGTPYPIDDNYGIPKKIYELTVKGFNSNSARRFIERMGAEFGKGLTQRSFESQKKELVNLMNYKSDIIYNFTKVIIPENDLIIPTKNQKNYWNGNNNIFTLSGGHYPFLLYNKWSELV